MCVLIGLMNLTASMDVLTIWREFEPQFDELCVGLCEGAAEPPLAGALWPADADAAPWAAGAAWGAASRNCTALCDGVARALDRTLLSPSDLPSSNVAFHLRMRQHRSRHRLQRPRPHRAVLFHPRVV